MLYRAYSDYLKEKYGEKVYKLPVNLAVTCPNRDGTLGTGGCIFCGEMGAGHESLPSSMSVKEQIEQNKAYIAQKYKAKKFIPYFQNFTNTYLPPDKLEGYLREALEAADDIVGLAVATRPDCLSGEHLELLDAVRREYAVDLTLELGLQTVNYHSLKKIRRGHTLAEFIDACVRIKSTCREIRICAQMILDLPWDEMDDVVEGAKILSALQVDEVKLHSLYVVKDTVLADWYERGEVTLKTKEEYIDRVIAFLEHIPKNMVIGRIIGRAPASDTIFLNWHTAWWKIRDEIEAKMREEGAYQGRRRVDDLGGTPFFHPAGTS